MAERVGIDRSFLADVERGKRNVSILNVELMAKGLRVSLSQLFSRAVNSRAKRYGRHVAGYDFTVFVAAVS
jgi:transcriptional regulator with XRE-family HTH domain